MDQNDLSNFYQIDITKIIDQKGKINFSTNPTKVFEIVLPHSKQHGFCHTLTFITCIVSLCLLKNYACILNDSQWVYGKWTDFFTPFWQERDFQAPITRLEVPYDPYIYGKIPEVEKIFRKVYSAIFTPLNTYPEGHDIDLAIHMRLGDHPYKLSIENYSNRLLSAIDKIMPKKIFLMSDQRNVIDIITKELRRTRPIEIVTFCPNHYNGKPHHIRSADNINVMLKEIDIAKSAKYFLASASEVSYAIDILREGKNVCYMHSPLYPVCKSTIDL